MTLHDFAATVRKMRELQRSPNILDKRTRENRRRLEEHVDAACAEILRTPVDDRVRETLDTVGDD